jgi:hypothetical protein
MASLYEKDDCGAISLEEGQSPLQGDCPSYGQRSAGLLSSESMIIIGIEILIVNSEHGEEISL